MLPARSRLRSDEDSNDFAQMTWKPLRFTYVDIELIQRGLDARGARLAGATLLASNHVQ